MNMMHIDLIQKKNRDDEGVVYTEKKMINEIHNNIKKEVKKTIENSDNKHLQYNCIDDFDWKGIYMLDSNDLKDEYTENVDDDILYKNKYIVLNEEECIAEPIINHHPDGCKCKKCKSCGKNIHYSSPYGSDSSDCTSVDSE